ncbi:agmatine/peptidylarginine deiminase [[Limnothrix rosea] IAM M-220]|uniref:agmatine deiminase family protein n=1 Tax=[Limnothrix rosea] IAM M-220 TaxID=454133 RepID=UPI000961675C|nr:agmatine deiminase family protein [[Limnothrix rosea] IAM M-220]OKH10966.1 agmatine deiminase [[Limnothrix rosea] IAM M-220]
MAGSFILSCAPNQLYRQAAIGQFFMPDEGQENVRTWMAFVANDYIWSRKQIPEVKRNLALIATTIAKYEPVSILVSPKDFAEAQQVFGDFNQYDHAIELIQFQLDDLWLRDTGPTFVFDSQGQKYGINFNFNGWGGKQQSAYDAMVADFITSTVDATAIASNLVLEGGSFEIDGHGMAILTRSSVLNKNRNQNIDEAIVEKELKTLLGIKKIIWLEGIKGKDITDGHVDFYARFARQGEVFVSRDNYPQSHDYQVTRQNIEVLQNATDLGGNPLKVTVIDAPAVINERFGVRDFAAGYLGYYLCNGAVIMQKFGDRAADQKAKEILAQAFPDRVIEQIAIDGIASGGGSVHCATQQEPAMPSGPLDSE